MLAYLRLLQLGLDKGFTVSVWDGEEWNPKNSRDLAEIQAAIESVEESTIKFRSADGLLQHGSALIIPHGVAPDETVVDHSITPWIMEFTDALLNEDK